MNGLIRACHPLPTVAVTACVTLLGWRLGWSGIHLVYLLAAILSGQLSIGWSNDAHDAQEDFDAARRSKPVVDGSITARQLWTAALIALLCCVPLTILAAGLWVGLLHFTAVGMAWLYNLRLSRTNLSWLPYAVAFICLPFFLCLGAPQSRLPSVWFVLAAAFLGVGAHLANAGIDLTRDRAGTAVWLGQRYTGALAAALLAMASLAVSLAILGADPVLAAVGALGAGTLLIAALLIWRRGNWVGGFRLVLLLAGWCVLQLLVAPGDGALIVAPPS